MTTTQTLAQFIAKHSVKMTAEWVDSNPHMADDEQWNRTANHYKYTLRCKGRRLTGYFSMGSGLSGEPEADDVLNCLASDAMGVENARDFADWAGEYGYDNDSIKALRTYKLCVRYRAKLKALLGPEAFEELLACEPL